MALGLQSSVHLPVETQMEEKAGAQAWGRQPRRVMSSQERNHCGPEYGCFHEPPPGLLG